MDIGLMETYADKLYQYELYPVVPLTCNNCGYLVWARKIDLLPCPRPYYCSWECLEEDQGE